MPFHESFDILAFRSRQHAFHFSQVLRDHGIASQIMSTPKEVLLGCRLSLRFSSYMRGKVLRIYKQFNSPVTGCYHVERIGSESKITRISI